jgi:lipid-A-disaccharide synthase
LKLFILCGEPSGDRIGADLVARLRERTEVELAGVGGPELIGQGLKSLFPMHELSVLGAEILPRIPWLLFRAWQTARLLRKTRPDIAVFVDAQIFSAVVAGRVRKWGVDVPIILYVAPSVWAWAPERAKKLVPLFDEVLSVLPMEPRIMAELEGPPTTYVGHPAARRLPFRAVAPQRGPLLLMPGSRSGELKRHLPLMRAVAERLNGHPRVTGFVLPTLAALEKRIRAEVADWPVKVEIAAGAEARDRACAEAVAACAAMGTATLELALAGVPMVGIYQANMGQARRYLKYKVKYASLPNNILRERVVPEVLFVVPDLDELTAAVRALLEGDGAVRQLEGFGRLRTMMDEGTAEAPLGDAVDRVLAHLPAGSPRAGA